MAIGSTFRDSRFGQFADPNFGATLSHSNRTTSPVLPAPADEDPHQSASANEQPGFHMDKGEKRYDDYGAYSNDWGTGSQASVLGNGKFSLGTRAWGENEVDPMTGNLGWKETYRDQTANAIAMADGGMVPDEDDYEQDSGNAAPAEVDPFGLVKQALNYGRKKYGLPLNMTTGQSSPSDFGSDAGNVGAPGFADGGMVEDDAPEQDQGMIPDPSQAQDAPAQGQQPNQPNPQALMGYLKGDGAAPPDVAEALEQQVDPTGSMDPNTRKAKAVAAAGTPDKQFGVLQHYRQKFNAYNAFAQASVQGVPGQRPPDLRASTHAATQAYQHLPDGTHIQFSPAQGGVKVTMKKVVPAKPAGPGGDQPDQNPFPTKDGGFGKRTAQNDSDEDDVQNFADGGEVEEDFQYDPSQDPMAAAGVLPGPAQDSEAAPLGDATSEDGVGGEAAPMDQDGPVKRALGGKRPDEAIKEFVLNPGQYLTFLKSAQADNVFDEGVDVALEKAASSGMRPGAPGTNAPVPTARPAAPGSGDAEAPPTRAADTTPKAQFPNAPAPRGDGTWKPWAPKDVSDDDAELARQRFPSVGDNGHRLDLLQQMREKAKERDVKRDQKTITGDYGVRRAEAGAAAKQAQTEFVEANKNNRTFQVLAQKAAKAKADNDMKAYQVQVGLLRTAIGSSMANNPELAGDPDALAKMTDGILQHNGVGALQAAPTQQQQAPQQQQQAQPQQGNGPVPSNPPPAGMKYQQNSAKTKWRLVPIQ